MPRERPKKWQKKKKKKIFFVLYGRCFLDPPVPILRIDTFRCSSCWFLGRESTDSCKKNKDKTNCSLGLILAHFSLYIFLLRIICNWQNTELCSIRRWWIISLFFCASTSVITTHLAISSFLWNVNWIYFFFLYEEARCDSIFIFYISRLHYNSSDLIDWANWKTLWHYLCLIARFEVKPIKTILAQLRTNTWRLYE